MTVFNTVMISFYVVAIMLFIPTFMFMAIVSSGIRPGISIGITIKVIWIVTNIIIIGIIRIVVGTIIGRRTGTYIARIRIWWSRGATINKKSKNYNDTELIHFIHPWGVHGIFIS
ncbi:hypothetical protein [uncultured Cocleimonas sp.]|uniref:hypothetical protein n=1 Tax=uncultured Cocleimonas sp. TaxID=1051587 RepID=UPI00260A5C55|nr:hypothetical protein [uncultured Cocleimonas sp.]